MTGVFDIYVNTAAATASVPGLYTQSGLFAVEELASVVIVVVVTVERVKMSGGNILNRITSLYTHTII